MQGIERRIVYIIRSESDRSRHYTGITSDVKGRLDWHNSGPSGYTVHNRPWSLVVSIEFPTENGTPFRAVPEIRFGSCVHEAALRTRLNRRQLGAVRLRTRPPD